jgi:tetratricopeptide (TPR) repeat protein
MAKKKNPSSLEYPHNELYIYIVSAPQERFLLKLDHNMIIYGKFENGKYEAWPQANMRLAGYNKKSKLLTHGKRNYHAISGADSYAIVPKKRLKLEEPLPEGVTLYEHYSPKNDEHKTQIVCYAKEEILNQILEVELRGMVNLPDLGTLMKLHHKWHYAHKNYNSPGGNYILPSNRCYVINNGKHGKLKVYTDQYNKINDIVKDDGTKLETRSFLAVYNEEKGAYRHIKSLIPEGEVVTLGSFGFFQETHRVMPKDLVFQVEGMAKGDEKLHLETGLKLKRENNFKEAKKEFEKCLEVNKANFKAHENIADLCAYNLQLPEEAITHYSKAISLDDQKDHPYYGRAHAYRALEKFDEALADYEKAIKLAPEHWYGYAQRGITLAFFMSNKKEGVEDYIKAMDRNARESYVELNGCEMLLTLNRHEENIKYLTKYEKTNPAPDDLIVSYYLRAISEIAIGQKAKTTIKDFKSMFKKTIPSKVDWGFEDIDKWTKNLKEIDASAKSEISALTSAFKEFLN